MCPLPQITSLPVSRKEQLALPEGPRLWGLSAYKFGREWKTLQRVGGTIGGSTVPIGPKGVAMQGRRGVDPVSVRAISGNWTSLMGFQEARTWGFHSLPTLRGFMLWGRSLGTGVSETGDT